MKKSLILLGMLSIGYAYAQEGNVGINTENPKATLDIVPETSNLAKNTNEGIIAPRLTKARIAGIADANLVEGTLVYATDNTYTGANTKVSKITEKGYYFYNGTEWVKVQYKDTDTNDAEWVYDDATKRINLKRSGTGNFKNQVFYDVSTGAFRDLGVESYSTHRSSVNNELVTYDTNNENYSLGHHRKIINSKDIPGGTHSISQRSAIIANEKSKSKYVITGVNEIIVEPQDATDYRSLEGSSSILFHSGTGNLGQGTAQTNRVAITNGAGTINTGFISSTHSRVELANAGEMNEVYVSNNVLRNFKVGGNIRQAVGNGVEFDFTNNSTSTITDLIGDYVFFKDTRGTHNIANAYGFRYKGLTGSNSMIVSNNYGLHIGDVKNGTNSNYSIYTNAGQVRFGDLADTSATADRTVVVDKDGVLKTGGSITSNNGVQNQSGMTCTAENAGKINYTTIQKDGKDVGVFGFCMQKGTDYVWAYMLGGSNIYGTSANGAAFGSGL